MDERINAVYWRIMDVCVDIEEGLKDHVQGTSEIIKLITDSSSEKEKTA